jgi:hypothetical protein
MNVRDGLERARAQAPRVEADLGRLHRRRVRRARASRIGTATLALVIGFAAIGGAWLAFRGEGAEQRPAAGSDVGPPAADLTLGDGDDYYMRVIVASPEMSDSGLVQVTEGFETWWATDDSGRIHDLDGRYYDEGVFAAGAFPSDTGDVTDLSTDPEQLEAQLRIRVEPGGASPEPYADWGGSIEWGLIRSIQELLESPDVTPAVKATLVQVAANLDGVTVDDRAVDPEGRAALLLTTRTEDKLTEWWFDPTSHQLLTSRETFDENDAVSTFTVVAAGAARSTDSDHLTREFITSPS